MTRVFTKRFFGLSLGDQFAVVAAHINDMESYLGRYVNPTHGGDTARRKHASRRAGLPMGSAQMVCADNGTCTLWKWNRRIGDV
jgi:hypothetical protein